MYRRFIFPVLIVAAGFGIMQLLASFKKEQKRMPPRPFIRTVATRKTVYSEITPTIESMGRVTSLEEVDLTPEVSGLILERNFKLHKGQAFHKGDVLMKIDTAQVFFSYSSTISDLQNALAGLLPELKTDNPEALGPWQTFFSGLSVDRLPTLPVTKSDREKLLATRYQVYKLYFLAQQQQNLLQKHTISAPFTGTVEETRVYPASMARTGVAVATLVRTDAIEIELALTEHQFPFIRPAMAAAVSFDDNSEPVTGSVHRVSNVLDPKMQTAAAFIRIEGIAAAGIKSGAYAKVRISGTPVSHAMTIPRKALHRKSFVYTIESDTLAEHRIDLAYLSVDTAYCTGGLDDGAVLITEPLQDAVIGMAVQDTETARKRQQLQNGVSSSAGRSGKSGNKATGPAAGGQ